MHTADQREWATEIVKDSFVRGIAALIRSQVVTKPYYEWKGKQDPIYSTLLEGMEDEQLAQTFVSFWTVGQTLASKSRFWLDQAVAEILLRRFREEGRSDVEVYPGWMLGLGFFKRRIPLSELGDLQREEVIQMAPWTVRMSQKCLRDIDVLVGDHERRHSPSDRDGGDTGSITEPKPKEDLAELRKAIRTLQGPVTEDVNLSCNLIVIEPDQPDQKPHAWAFRFVNPKVMSQHATRKDERANLLRLYAYLVQEKILRDPNQIRVAVAALVPRRWQASGRRPQYFTPKTYMTAERLWEFVGVPFEAIEAGVRAAGKELGKRLRRTLTRLLPDAPKEPPPQGSLFA